MRLINKKTNRPIVEFRDGQCTFFSKFLEHEMASLGIVIPHGLRGVYHGKMQVTLEDVEFEQAFKEIYYVTNMDPQQFSWIQEHKIVS